MTNERWLDEETFKCVVEHTPLVSIDLIVENKNGEILLGKRKNRPAKNFLFVPGGRILKGETILEAFNRITLSELGKMIPISAAEFIGVFEHFYDDSFFGSDITTHYVVLAYKLVNIYDLNLPKLQHAEYLWLSSESILGREDVHPYTKAYFVGETK
ncbi:GDP-mannose mannosyl hydrolase [Desulfurobacterium sp. TC5-1]|uniref:GDP-mannose mannosyl hydrolase n=1 Tax=Desulfurobacterium sp. TC5-1 TaxID=1158318 RepID=UPI0003B76966|nr:GDP-mannose mannosyl hydrolase [Desulfurobacterium sp. TC5-1]